MAVSGGDATFTALLVGGVLLGALVFIAPLFIANALYKLAAAQKDLAIYQRDTAKALLEIADVVEGKGRDPNRP